MQISIWTAVVVAEDKHPMTRMIARQSYIA